MVRNNRSLTAVRKDEMSTKVLKNIPMEKAIHVGKGKIHIVEFSDPDCPYCRRADQYLSGRDDVTINLFMYPLNSHRDAKKKSLMVLCSANQAATYKDVMNGKYDTAFNLPDGCEAKYSAMLDQHLSWGQKLGVAGTPAFWINGQRVDGVNIPEIERLLTAGK
jgi:thiol:disulfide interchange protein DsbC